MIELRDIQYDHDHPNESRANYGSRIEFLTPDWGSNPIETDITDALADVVHFIHRVGLDPRAIFFDALDSAEGDLEDGPEAAVVPSIRAAHDEGMF